MRRKSPKTHQGPPGPWTPGEGGLAPFDPLASCPSGIVCDNLNPQTSSEAILPRHGLTTESMATVKHREKNKTDLPTQLKVANRSIFLAEGSPARCVSERKKGGNYALAGSRGAALGAPLVTFPATGKSPGVWGGAPKSGGAGAASPAQTPGVWGGAPKSGGVGAASPAQTLPGVPSMAKPCSRGAPKSGGAGAASPAQTLPGVPSMAKPCSRGAPADAARVEKETAQSKTAPSLWCLCIGKLSD